MTLPLTTWQLSADSLPEDMLPAAPAAFTLPGVRALEDFADLLGGDEKENQEEETDRKRESAPFSLPALLPEGAQGAASLRREIDFGALIGDRAVLTIDCIAGRGRILLGEQLLCAFDSARFDADALYAAHTMTAQPCILAVDLTDALELGRKEALLIEFDDARPAGLPGPVLLHVAQGAHLSHVRLTPDGKRQTISLSAQITAERAGRYVLRAQAIPAKGEPPSAWELPVTLQKGETKAAKLSLSLPAAPFVPGAPYEASAVKIQLFARKESAASDGTLSDSALLLCGYPAKASDAWLPLGQPAGDPSALAKSLRALHIPAVSFSAPVCDSYYRALIRAGVAVRQVLPIDHPLRETLLRLPTISLTDTPEATAALTYEQSAWQLCSMTASPRALDETLSPREMLMEASGLPLDPREPSVREALEWLRSVSVRLRAEAARQERYHGAICNPDEWMQEDVASALCAAFAPVHLSALPLCGAWWTLSHFSATLHAFLPADQGGDYIARAVLEDSEGHVLARLEKPCRPGGGYVGVIEAALPDRACVLELTTQLLRGGNVMKESTLPVYVGERGPLEPAFIAQ